MRGMRAVFLVWGRQCRVCVCGLPRCESTPRARSSALLAKGGGRRGGRRGGRERGGRAKIAPPPFGTPPAPPPTPPLSPRPRLAPLSSLSLSLSPSHRLPVHRLAVRQVARKGELVGDAARRGGRGLGALLPALGLGHKVAQERGRRGRGGQEGLDLLQGPGHSAETDFGDTPLPLSSLSLSLSIYIYIYIYISS